MNKEYNLALIGFGTVGTGFLKNLIEREHELKEEHDLEVSVVSISNSKGTLFDKNGLNVQEILELRSNQEKNALSSYERTEFKQDSYKRNFDSNVDILVETTPTNLETGEPGLSYIKEGLKNGKDVITTNKGPIALKYPKLCKLAKENNSQILFEGTVLAGTPAINFIRNDLAGSNVKSIRGIFNGTTNYILSKMEKNNKSFDSVLKEAQELGYAEADPSADVDGWDAAAKVSILANVIFNKKVTPDRVNREGIRKIDLNEIKNSKKENKRIKLIAEVEKDGNTLNTSVKPKKLEYDDSLAQVMGATNALSVKTDHLGEVSVIGPGAGEKETGQAILNDLIRLSNQR